MDALAADAGSGLYRLAAACTHAGSGVRAPVCTDYAIAAYTRFTATLHSIAGFYNLQLYLNQYFKQQFLTYLTPENVNMAERLNYYRAFFTSKGFTPGQAATLTDAAIWQNLTQQSQLLTSRALFMLFAMLSLFLLLLIVAVPAVYRTILFWKQTAAARNDECPNIIPESANV